MNEQDIRQIRNSASVFLTSHAQIVDDAAKAEWFELSETLAEFTASCGKKYVVRISLESAD